MTFEEDLSRKDTGLILKKILGMVSDMKIETDKYTTYNHRLLEISDRLINILYDANHWV